jgi:chorismate mutase
LLAARAGAGVPNNGIVSIQEKITEYQADITEKEAELKPLLDERRALMAKVTRGRNLLTKLKQKLTLFRSTRKSLNSA